MEEKPDFSQFSFEQISHWVIQHERKELRQYISKMTPEQIGIAVTTLKEKRIPDWRDKITDIIESLTEVHQLEVVGKTLNTEQLLEILDRSKSGEISEQQAKLPSLFVGISQQVFSEMLEKASSGQLEVLKHESITEPVQHHLNLFIHQTIAELNQHGEILSQLEQGIQKVDPKELTYAEVQAFKEKIENIHHLYASSLNKTKQALSIAWNTTRSDLVEKLSLLKEKSQKVCQYIMGTPGANRISTNGLHSILEKRLAAVYGDPNNLEDIKALRDDEPAIEALVKLSIWYLRDYWEIGLLPSIELDELDLDPALHDENERVHYREKLFAEVDQNLQKLGLLTVKDLKEAEVYSRKSLMAFIHANKNLLID